MKIKTFLLKIMHGSQEHAMKIKTFLLIAFFLSIWFYAYFFVAVRLPKSSDPPENVRFERSFVSGMDRVFRR